VSGRGELSPRRHNRRRGVTNPSRPDSRTTNYTINRSLNRRGLTMLVDSHSALNQTVHRRANYPVPIVVRTCFPLVYGALYLWAFWDPFSVMSQILWHWQLLPGRCCCPPQFNVALDSQDITADAAGTGTSSPREAQSGVGTRPSDVRRAATD